MQGKSTGTKRRNFSRTLAEQLIQGEELMVLVIFRENGNGE
jgi:hypothetical protein